MGVVRDRYATQVEELSHSEKYVFYYIDNNLEKVPSLNLTELAKEIGTSNTTIIRMCKKLGCEGFSQFKFELQKIAEKTVVREEMDILGYYQFFAQNILSDIRVQELDYIAKKALQATNIFIIAVGLSKPLGDYLANRFLQFQKIAICITTSHMIDLLPKMLTKNDIVIYISLSGQTKTIVQSAEKIRYKNIPVFSFTNNPQGPLSTIARVNISSNVPKNVYAGYDITSRSFLMLQLDVLLDIYLKKLLK